MPDDRTANEILMGSGYPTAKFDRMRVWVGGTITAKPTTRQETEFGTGKAKVYPKSGDPIMGILVDVQTDERLDAEDNGIRRMYIEGRNLKDATRDAVQASGASGLDVGGQLFLAWIADGEPPFPNANPPKIYEGRYYPPTTPVPAATNGRVSEPMPDPGQPAAPVAPPMPPPSSGLNEFAPMPQGAAPPAFAQTPQEAPTAPMSAPPVSSPAPAYSDSQKATQGPDPTAEAIAALRAAGLDPATVFPNYQG